MSEVSHSRSARADRPRGVNLSDLVRDAARTFPARPALLFHSRPVTFSRLDELVDLTAAALIRLGVARGDRVALLLGNVPEFVYGLYGALRAGAIACPLDVMLSSEEVASVLGHAEASVVITDLAQLPGLLSTRDRVAPLDTLVVVGGPPAPAGTISLEEALTQAVETPSVSTEADDPAVLAYASDTTSEARGVLLTHANLLANLDQVSSVPALAQNPSDVAFLALPLSSVFALNVALGSTLSHGAAAILEERFATAEGPRVAKRDGATVLFGAPGVFAGWLSSPEPPEPDLSSVRLAVSGLAPLPAGVAEGLEGRFGVTICNGYGLAEVAGAATTTAVREGAKPNSIGLALPRLELRLVGADGEHVEDGDPGEILLRGPNVFREYWKNPDLTASAFEGDWLKTGDVAYRDDDGCLFLVDPVDDVVIVSGFHVYPKEVEDAIEAHPKVAEAAVVGVPDARTGEAVRAWVAPKSGDSLAPEEIFSFLDGRIARFKWPKVVEVLEELPRDPSGRPSRRALRDRT